MMNTGKPPQRRSGVRRPNGRYMRWMSFISAGAVCTASDTLIFAFGGSDVAPGQCCTCTLVLKFGGNTSGLLRGL